MSAFEVMRRASLGVFGAVALASVSVPVGAFALSRAANDIKSTWGLCGQTLAIRRRPGSRARFRARSLRL